GAMFPLYRGVQLADRVLHRESGPDGALRIILAGHRRTEHRHDGIADVLVDRAAVALDLAREGAKERGKNAAQILGVQSLPKRGSDCPSASRASGSGRAPGRAA